MREMTGLSPRQAPPEPPRCGEAFFVAVGAVLLAGAVVCGIGWFELGAQRYECSNPLVSALGVQQCASVSQWSLLTGVGVVVLLVCAALCWWHLPRR